MTKEEAIKYLQQLYPNGGHCWLDEQRIESIGMAIKALQEEPVIEDLEEAAYQYGDCFGKRFDIASMAFIKGAKWQKAHLIDKACEWLKEQDEMVGVSFEENFIERFKNYMKGE